MHLTSMRHVTPCYTADLSLSQVHGLEHYNKTREQTYSWPKSMVHPDKTFGHHVHDSLDLPGHRYTKIDPNKCIRFLHLVNMFKKRWGGDGLYSKLTVPFPAKYFWALQKHAQFRQP
jgi:homoserine trans-succinylase